MYAHHDDSSSFDARVLALGGFVFERFDGASRALLRGDLDAAESLIRADEGMNVRLRELDLAMAHEAGICGSGPQLRCTSSASRCARELERIERESESIAAATVELLRSTLAEPSGEFLRVAKILSNLARTHLRRALDIFATKDRGLAARQSHGDDEMSGEYRGCLRSLMAYVMEDARHVGTAVHMMVIATAFERIGFLCACIARHISVWPGPEGESATASRLVVLPKDMAIEGMRVPATGRVASCADVVASMPEGRLA